MQTAHFADAPVGQGDRLIEGCATALAGALKQLDDGRFDAVDAAVGALQTVLVADLLGQIDDAAGIHDEVGDVEDVAGREVSGELVFGELVVGAADDGRAPQLGDGLAVEGAAEGAGREDIAFGGMDSVGSGDVGPDLLGEGLQRLLVDVGDGETGAVRGQKPREGATHFANTLDGDMPA